MKKDETINGSKLTKGETINSSTLTKSETINRSKLKRINLLYRTYINYWQRGIAPEEMIANRRNA